MDFSTIFVWLPKLVGAIGAIQEALRSGGSVIDIINKVVPEIKPLLIEIAMKYFPTLSIEQAPIAGIDLIFDKEGTTWVQNMLIKLKQSPAPGAADGIYGNLTKASVTAYQKARGLKEDGWAGPQTSGSLAVEAAKLPA